MDNASNIPDLTKTPEWAKDQLSKELKGDLGSLLDDIKDGLSADEIKKVFVEIDINTAWNNGLPKNSARYVLALQSALHTLGFGEKVKTIDALFGGATKAGLREFQKSWNNNNPNKTPLVLDGQPGLKTLTRILESLDGHPIENIQTSIPTTVELNTPYKAKITGVENVVWTVKEVPGFEFEGNKLSTLADREGTFTVIATYDDPKNPGQRIPKETSVKVSDSAKLEEDLGEGYEIERRINKYFWENARRKTFDNIEELGGVLHEIKLTEDHVITQIFEEASINLEGEKVYFIEIPNTNAGDLFRPASTFNSDTDQVIMKVPTKDYGVIDTNPILKYAHTAGYSVSVDEDWDSTVSNELLHEVASRYFPSVFIINQRKNISEPFSSFELDGLTFKTNHQAEEFLSDVMDWNTHSGRSYVRLFWPLGDMYDPDYEDRYSFSRQFQKLTMKKILEEKGYENPDITLKKLCKAYQKVTLNGFPENESKEVFSEIKKHFSEKDLALIAKEYRAVGVQLIQAINPYFQHTPAY